MTTPEDDPRHRWSEELEESAQGTDLFESPGQDALIDQAREDAVEAAAGPTSAALVASVRARRISLGEAMRSLESAISKAASSEGWADGVAASANELKGAFHEHVTVTEGPGGLLEEVVEVAPRLESEAAIIETEHRALEDALRNLEQAMSLTGTALSPDPEGVRRRAMIVLARLALHRQRGADIVYEAYNVDIATAD